MTEAPFTIRRAAERDIPTILAFIRGLAEYERMLDGVQADEDLLRRHLFGPRPRAEVLIAEVNREPAGFALYFWNFSTFLGRPGIYLEDLFVLPELRGRGIGTALMAELAAEVVREGGGRLEWSVLDWNEPSIAFYRALGAVAIDEWTVHRLAGAALVRLSTRASTV